MRLTPETHGARARLAETSADNAIATLTIQNLPGESWVLDKVMVGYPAAVAGIKTFVISVVQFGTTQSISLPIPELAAGLSGRMLSLDFPDNCLWSDKDTDIVITLTASGTGGLFGHIHAIYH